MPHQHQLYSRRAGDDSDEEDNILRPALAVHGDPTDEDSPPSDGLEYLRRVKKEASALPNVVSAAIEPARLRAAEARLASRSSDPATSITASLPPAPSALLPSRQWQLQVLSDFTAMRLRLQRQARLKSPPHLELPASHDATGWARFLNLGQRAGGQPVSEVAEGPGCDEAGEMAENGCGEEEGKGNDEAVPPAAEEPLSVAPATELTGWIPAVSAAASAPRKPLLELIAALDQPRAIALLQLLSDAVRRDGPSTVLGQWMYALLARCAHSIPPPHCRRSAVLLPSSNVCHPTPCTYCIPVVSAITCIPHVSTQESGLLLPAMMCRGQLACACHRIQEGHVCSYQLQRILHLQAGA